MRSALKILVIIWSCISLLSLGALFYLLPSYVIDGAFAELFKTPNSPALEHWFDLSEISLIAGFFMTGWLWWTYRKHYGNFRGQTERE